MGSRKVDLRVEGAYCMATAQRILRNRLSATDSTSSEEAEAPPAGPPNAAPREGTPVAVQGGGTQPGHKLEYVSVRELLAIELS